MLPASQTIHRRPDPAATQFAAFLDDAATRMDDLRLRARLEQRLGNSSLRRVALDMTVAGGLVQLRGRVRDARLRSHLEWLAFTTPGVTAVCSEWSTDAPNGTAPVECPCT